MTLIDELIKWWHETYLVLGTFVYLDMDSAKPDLDYYDMASFESWLSGKIFPGDLHDGIDIVDELNYNSYLIFVDHLDSWTIPPKTGQQVYLKKRLDRVHGGSSFFIFGLRMEER